MRVTATEAKNCFGSLCAQAKREPVFVEKAGQLDTVILSAEQYQALKANQDKASIAARKKAFEADYADWIAAQNARFETHGIPGADLRPWGAAMAQYDVFANPSLSATAGIPYVVVVQSDLLDALATRLTMPLAVLDVATKVPTVLCPVIMVKGQRLHALAHYAAPLPATALRGPLENVASQASALVSALDAVLSGV